MFVVIYQWNYFHVSVLYCVVFVLYSLNCKTFISNFVLFYLRSYHIHSHLYIVFHFRKYRNQFCVYCIIFVIIIFSLIYLYCIVYPKLSNSFIPPFVLYYVSIVILYYIAFPELSYSSISPVLLSFSEVSYSFIHLSFCIVFPELSDQFISCLNCVVFCNFFLVPLDFHSVNFWKYNYLAYIHHFVLHRNSKVVISDAVVCGK